MMPYPPEVRIGVLESQVKGLESRLAKQEGEGYGCLIFVGVLMAMMFAFKFTVSAVNDHVERYHISVSKP